MHRSHGLQGFLKRCYTLLPYFHQWVSHIKRVLAQSSTKRPTFAFTGESGYTLGSRRKIAHNGSHGETVAFRMGGGITTLGAFHTVRKPCVAGCQNGVLCRFGILAGRCSRRTQKAFGTAMRLCVSLSRGVAAPLGCVIFFSLLSKLWLVRPAFRAFRVYGAGVVSLPSACSACCRSSRHPLVKAANLPFSEVG